MKVSFFFRDLPEPLALPEGCGSWQAGHRLWIPLAYAGMEFIGENVRGFLTFTGRKVPVSFILTHKSIFALHLTSVWRVYISLQDYPRFYMSLILLSNPNCTQHLKFQIHQPVIPAIRMQRGFGSGFKFMSKIKSVLTSGSHYFFRIAMFLQDFDLSKTRTLGDELLSWSFQGL